jgi:hypothetical protein
MEEIWHHDKVSTLCNFIRYFSVSLRNIHVEVTDNKLHHKALETRYSVSHMNVFVGFVVHRSTKHHGKSI